LQKILIFDIILHAKKLIFLVLQRSKFGTQKLMTYSKF